MKHIILSLCLVSLTACKTETEFGECIGFQEDESPELKYEISVRNAVWTAIAIETVVAPVLWFLTTAKCPVAKK